MRRHWPFLLLALLGLVLIFARLGADYLWADEGDTAVLGSSILKYGVPRAWDGVSFIDSDKGARVNDHFVMVSSPWVQYFVTAGSFLLFGRNEIAARLPFAIAGWLTIILVYVFVYRLALSRASAFFSAALLLLSLQFLLYARQCRYYALGMLFTCALFAVFFRLNSARRCLFFIIIAVLLFHTHPMGIVPVAVLGTLTFVYRPFFPQRRWFVRALPVILLLTLPWLALAHRGYAENAGIVQSFGQFCARVVQYLVECASVTPLPGVLLLLAVYLVFSGLGRTPGAAEEAGHATSPTGSFRPPERDFVVGCLLTLAGYAAAMALTQSTRVLWFYGVRYTSAIIPLTAMLAGILMVRVTRGRAIFGTALVLLFSLTNAAQLAPWAYWSRQTDWHVGRYQVWGHTPSRMVDALLPTSGVSFLSDMRSGQPGVVGHACRFLREHARPNDLVFTNADWEPLSFYTGLKQAMNIQEGFPIYEAARRGGLPDYVFQIRNVRWIVWQPYWEGYNSCTWSALEEQIRSGGGQLEEVATFPETVWENREDLNFRRFGKNDHLFEWSDQPTGKASIFRVDWPNDPAPGTVR